MSITMYSASVPVFSRMLGNIPTWFDKAEAHAEARKFDAANYLGLRLAPDMLTLVAQVQIAADTAKSCVARLAGVDAPKFDDNEASIADLRARIARTLDFIGSVPASAIEGSEAKEVSVPRRSGPLIMPGEAYLKHFALPNFFFHVTTTYALLRQAGVEIGKMDYLGAPR